MRDSDTERPSLSTVLLIGFGIAVFFGVLFLALGNVEQVMPSGPDR